MSRTKRNIEYAKWYTKPKTQNYRKALHHSKKEILEELGSNYLNGNSKDYKSIVHSWEDKKISARNEVLDFSYYIERMVEQKIISLYGELPKWLQIDFNKQKNRIEMTKMFYYFYKYSKISRPQVVYLPFCFKHKKYEYPVVVYEHNWYR